MRPLSFENLMLCSKTQQEQWFVHRIHIEYLWLEVYLHLDLPQKKTI